MKFMQALTYDIVVEWGICIKIRNYLYKAAVFVDLLTAYRVWEKHLVLFLFCFFLNPDTVTL